VPQQLGEAKGRQVGPLAHARKSEYGMHGVHVCQIRMRALHMLPMMPQMNRRTQHSTVQARTHKPVSWTAVLHAPAPQHRAPHIR
jgi:hypothetical protein